MKVGLFLKIFARKEALFWKNSEFSSCGEERPQSTPQPPRAEDRAFAPPAYNGENAAPPAAPPPASSALSSFLEKHDSAVKRIDPSEGGKR